MRFGIFGLGFSGVESFPGCLACRAQRLPDACGDQTGVQGKIAVIVGSNITKNRVKGFGEIWAWGLGAVCFCLFVGLLVCLCVCVSVQPHGSCWMGFVWS